MTDDQIKQLVAAIAAHGKKVAAAIASAEAELKAIYDVLLEIRGE